MNCPACNRILAQTLSVCPTCGTMVNDSVREELAQKILPLAKPTKVQVHPKLVVQKTAPEKPVAPATAKPPMAETPPVPVVSEKPPSVSKAVAGSHTTEIMSKHTSPILVEFQNKNAVVPEWRLQLQNSVRRRTGGGVPTESQAAIYQKVLVTKGATALKTEAAEQTEAAISANPTLENALRRIEQSRQKYSTEEKPKLSIVQNSPKNLAPLPGNLPETLPIIKKDSGIESNAAKPKATLSFSQAKFEKFDTNKLPPLPAKVVSSFERSAEIPFADTEIAEGGNNLPEVKGFETAGKTNYAESIDGEVSEITEDEGDDRAPLAARFNAGFFDLIIGAFMSVILLAPFTLANGNLFTFQGLLAFMATCSIVMFIYLTTTVGMMGRTLGMKLFSLELVDIEGNTYPSFHQAAVSSSVYIVSLALGGIGFLTLLLNDEKRAAHDLVSGTIVVKEYE